MARVIRYYCPICLMDTDFRITGSGAHRVYICSDCCVEFMQEPQAASETDAVELEVEKPSHEPAPIEEATVGFSPTEIASESGESGDPEAIERGDTLVASAGLAAAGLPSGEDLGAGSESAAEPPATHPTSDPRTACFLASSEASSESAGAMLENDDTASLEACRRPGEEPGIPAAAAQAEERAVRTGIEVEPEPAPRPSNRLEKDQEVLPAIGVLGPTSGGKSIYIARLIDRLSRSSIRLDEDLELFTTPFQDVGSWAELSKEILDPLRRGVWPANTPRPQSRTIDIRLRGSRSGQGAGEDFCLRFLDCAGESLLTWLKNQRKAKEDPNFDPIFESEEMSRTYSRIDEVIRSSRGLLLLVSPEHSPMLSGASSGQREGEDFAGYFFQYLFDFQKQARVKYHIAIAFTKYDRFRSIIDPDNVEEFARRYFAQMNNTLQGFFDGQYRYFAISSVGHIYHPLGLDGRPVDDVENPSKGDDGRPAPLAIPMGVEQPLLWLIGRAREEGQLSIGGGA